MFGSQQVATQQQVIDEIKSFSAMRAGWNSYHAPKISPDAIKVAVEVVEIIARRGAPLPTPAPTPLGGVALTWDLPESEVQLLIDEQSLEYSVARRGHPKVTEQGALEMHQVEQRFIDRYLIRHKA